MEAQDIPDEEVPDYAVKVWIGPPKGHESSIEGVEGLRYMAALPDFSEHVTTVFRIVLEPEDLQAINKSGHFWLGFLGGSVIPFTLMTELPEPETLDEPEPETGPTGLKLFRENPSEELGDLGL